MAASDIMKRTVRLTLALIASLAWSKSNLPAAPPPNIILLLADDLGWTGIGPYGNTLHETPNLDRLAREGMKFTDAYSACTVCSPTRASLMTGKYPARLRLTDYIAGQNQPFEKLTIPDWTKFLRPEETTIAEALKTAGYATAHVGKWHLEPPKPEPGRTTADYEPTAHGFDSTVDKPKGTRGYSLPADFPRADGSRGGYLTDYLTDQALAVIQQNRAKPFFLYFAYHTPHTPIEGKPELVRHYERKLETRPDIRIRNATYAAMIHSLDESVGRVLRQVEELGLAKSTFILFVSDNGGLTQRNGRIDHIADNAPLRRGKGSAYEGGVRVPFIARWPGVIPAGTMCAEPVMTIDFYPTALALAGLPAAAKPGATLDGQNLLGLLKQPDTRLDRAALYWHYPHYHAGGDAPYSAIRQGNWRAIDFHDDTPDALYDLSNDPGETRNLATTNAEKFAELQTRLARWRNQVGAQMPAPNPNFDPAKAGQDGAARTGRKKTNNN